jgi:hypothetical protein
MSIFTHFESNARVLFPHDAVSAAKFILEDRTGETKVNTSALVKYPANRKVTYEKFNQITDELLKDSHKMFQ